MEKFSAFDKSGFFNSRAVIVLAICASALFLATFSPARPQRTRNRIKSTVRDAAPAAVATATPSASPTVMASTYLGGTGFEITWACATDANGNVYIAGDAQPGTGQAAADLPVTQNALQKNYAGGGEDGFVAKFDRYGNLLWSTYLGGSGWDGVYGLTVDAAGNVVVTGVTASSDFPITANAVQKTIAANTDAAFVTVISADGTQVLYSTFLGGTIGTSAGPLPVNIGHILPTDGPFTIGVGVAMGNDGTIYLAGGTNTIDMPVTPVGVAAQPALAGEENGFVARIDPTKSGTAGLIYCTYLGGALKDFAAAVAVDPSGDAFVTGEAQSLNFPTTLGAYQRTHTPGTAGFVTELNPTGTALIYSTLVSGSQGSSAGGGTNYNAPSGIAIDSAGHAFIAGETNATDFPTTTGVVQPNFAGQDDGFVTELSADGSSLVFSTYLGGSDYDGLFAIKINNGGNIFVGGYSASRDLILKNAFQTAFGDYYEGWVAELSPDGTTLLFSSYLGGNDQNSIYGLALWNDQLYLGGRTASTSFPVTNGAAQETYGGGVWDNFLTIVDLNPTPVQLLSAVSRKTHGAAGTFDVDLPLSGTPGIECRSGGVDGDYTIVSTFANAIANVADVEIGSGAGTVSSANIDPNDAHNYIINLTGITNAQTITITLSGLGDSADNFSSSIPVSMSVLIGDTTGNGQVNSSDIAQTESQSGQPVTSANFREDVTANGEINSSDIALVQSKSGIGLPEQSSAAAVKPSSRKNQRVPR